MRTKLATLVAASALLLAACSTSGTSDASSDTSTGSSAPVAFSGFVGGPGIEDLTQVAIDAFNSENPQYDMTLISGQNNQSPYQQLLAMYASGDVPGVFVIDSGDVKSVADKLVDLSDQPFVADMYSLGTDQGTVDGKVLAVPQGATGVGFLYNRQVIEDAIGGSFDPSTIATVDDLAALFAQIQAAGTAPVVVSPLNWSLGAHFFGKFYDAQGDIAARDAFTAGLKAGTVDVAGNDVFNGLMDTFDLMLKYNLNKETPIAGTIDTDSKAFADGEAAFWFMGDFQWSTLAALGASADGDGYGIMAVPVSNDASDPYNQEIQVTSNFMLAVDSSVNTPEQQEAAIAYINWYVTSASGQDYMVNGLGTAPTYGNVTVEPASPLGRATMSAMADGTSYTPTASLPADHWNVLGDDLVKYMAGNLDRAGFAAAVTDYWQGQE